MEPETSKLCTSLLAVQKNLEAVKKSATNPFFNSKYANLESVLAVVKPVLEAENLLLLQPCGKDSVGSYVATEIRNSTGEAVSCRVYLIEPADMQKLGAAITYARRYGLTSLLAMEQEDDDGEGTMGRGKKPPHDLTQEVLSLAQQINDPAVNAAVTKELALQPTKEKLQNLRTRLINRLNKEQNHD